MLFISFLSSLRTQFSLPSILTPLNPLVPTPLISPVLTPLISHVPYLLLPSLHICPSRLFVLTCISLHSLDHLEEYLFASVLSLKPTFYFLRFLFFFFYSFLFISLDSFSSLSFRDFLVFHYFLVHNYMYMTFPELPSKESARKDPGTFANEFLSLRPPLCILSVGASVDTKISGSPIHIVSCVRQSMRRSVLPSY